MILRPLLSLFGRDRTAPARPPRLPAGLCVYAVGDVHGEARLLDRLLDRLRADMAPVLAAGERVELVFLGDYVDRGPDSRGVLDRLAALPDALPPGCRCRFLRGNHEAAMEAFLVQPAAGADWLAFGGTETLASYGIAALADGNGKARLQALARQLDQGLPAAHRAFLAGLELTVIHGDYLFVHAGLRPGTALARQRAEDMLWIREPFLSSLRRGEHTVVHGHTVTDAVTFHPDCGAPIRIGIDTGAYATGVLSAVRLRGEECRVLQTAGPA